jgi:hypothetical protein
MELGEFRVARPRAVGALLLAAAVAGHFWSLGYRPVHLPPFGGRADPTPIALGREPEQTDLAPEDPRSIVVKRRGAVAIVEPQRRYQIAGAVVLADLYYTDDLAVVSPVDLSLVWGPPATDPARIAGVEFRHFLRFGAYQWRGDTTVDADLLRTHFSNNHLIPATDRIRQALTSIDVGDRVVLSGYLANVTVAPHAGGGAFEGTTSLTRDDTGAGACEIVYVTGVRINSTRY